MKSALKLIFLLSFYAAYGQNISDYKYILLPEKFSGKGMNNYDLAKNLSSQLKQKGYEIVTGDPLKSGIENCSIAYVDLLNTSSLLKNKVKIEFKDCNGKILSSSEATSYIKEYEDGYPDALATAAKNIPRVNPNAALAEKKLSLEEGRAENMPISTKNSPMDDEKLKNRGGHEIQNDTKVSNYTYGNQSLKKINLSASQFILVSDNSSVPYATFKESGRAGIYHVTLENGAHALGYFESGKIIVELPNGDGFRKMELNLY